MSVYSLSTRMSSVENSVDELGQKADSYNTSLSGTTTVYGSALLNGPVTFGSTITGIDISDVKDLQTALTAKAATDNPIFTGTANFTGASSITGITKTTVGLGNVDNTSDNDKPISALTQNALNAKADSSTTYTKGEVDTELGKNNLQLYQQLLSL